MSEQIDRLRATVSELEQELHSLQTVDDETQRLLRQALQEIRTFLHEEEQAALQRRTLSDQLQTAAQSFEGSHPALAGLLSRLIDGLGQMGI
jgi:chromosome segregation ATPase